VATDASGNGRHGTYPSTTLPARQQGSTLIPNYGPGFVGNLQLVANTANNYVTIPTAAWMDTTDWTALICVSVTSGTDNTNGDGLINRYGAGAFHWTINKSLNISGLSRWEISARNHLATTFTCTSPTGLAIPTNAHMVLGRWNSTTHKLELFDQTGLLASTTTTGTAETGARALEVGRYSSAATTTPGGYFSTAAFWGRALTDAEVAEIVKRYATPSDMVPVFEHATHNPMKISSGGVWIPVNAYL
jgi:hypothetical protein